MCYKHLLFVDFFSLKNVPKNNEMFGAIVKSYTKSSDYIRIAEILRFVVRNRL
jgi:hypothetical protein